MRFVTCRPQSSEALYSEDNHWSIVLDIIEEKDQYVLKADLPGVKKEDIKVSLEDNILTIEAQRQSEAESQDRQIHRIERTYGKYKRTLNLGANVDAAKIKANLKDGVLELIVPKSEEVKPKSIDIQVG